LKHLLDVVASRSHALRGMPKYAALYHGLVGAIESGVWKPGDQLPPEDVIARGVNLSLGTVQRALRMLADEGIVVRQHGRGTFVAGVEGRREQVRHYRFLADDGLTVLPLYSRTLAIREVPGEGAVADFFTPESRLIEIRRIINVNLEFQCLDTIFLSAARFPGFLEMRPNELDGVSLNYELDTRYNAPTMRTVQQVQCMELPAAACREMALEPGSVGLQWETLGYTYRDAPLFFQHCFLPPSRRRLLIDGSGPAGSRSLV
jgi:DNA-binding GntR family transcriptional regulator